MIVYPQNWNIHYDLISAHIINEINISKIVNNLTQVLSNIGIKHLAYSGGIDSTIILCLISDLFKDISTYTISIRESHPDILFARAGSSFYKSDHHEFIINPIHENDLSGDNAVRQLFNRVSSFTNSIICCDGIDEFMCGYYKHMEHNDLVTYKQFLKQLLPNHLEPLNKNTKDVKVYLPYLNKDIITIFNSIPLDKKADSKNRKKVVCDIARYLGIPDSIIYRNKYGFCDAFLKTNK